MEPLPNDQGGHPIQHKDKLCIAYFRIYNVHQMLTSFILLCVILIISLFQSRLVLVGKSWWRQISDWYLFLILNFGMDYLI